MNDQVQLVICPWCMATVEVPTDGETFNCPVCNREFTEGDIEDANNEND